MESDSDASYGSEGGLKEKPVPVKKRGGRKRAKKPLQANESDSDAESADYSEITDVAESQTATNGASLKKERDAADRGRDGAPRGRPPEQPRKNIQMPDDDSDDESVQMPQKPGRDFEEEKMSERHSEADSTPKINVRPNVQFGQGAAGGPKETSGGRGRRPDYSPPMIKEYDPNEENAKTRAARRRAELKKKREQSMDKELHRKVPDDPRPWKGKPSEFFVLHQPRRGTHKVLNNEQKDFLLIYYPDSVVPPISLMEGLYKQAKEHEDKEQEKKAGEEGLVVRGKKKNRKKQRPADRRDVYRLVHVNQESRDIRDRKAVDF